MEGQGLLEYFQKNGLYIYVYNINNCKLISLPIPESRFSHHTLAQIIEFAGKVFKHLQDCGKYELIADISENILFSKNYNVRPSQNQVRNSLRRFENFVQAIGFLLYGYNYPTNAPNYYNGSNLPMNQKGMSIKDSHLQILIRGEVGSVRPLPLPMINGHRPFVSPDDKFQNNLLHTILLFRGKLLHLGEIDYDHYVLYNVGGVASNAIRNDLAISALLMIEYHYQDLKHLFENNI